MDDVLEIIRAFYPEDTPLRRLLLKHSMQVRDKALDLLDHAPAAIAEAIDRDIVDAGALLHDIGIIRCHAPGILCMGTEPYLAHGIIGAGMLREYGRRNALELEIFARICERHTGSGLTAAEVAAEKLPIPVRDYLPETLEEKVICLADKFFSKSGDMQEKSLPRVRHSIAKFGSAPTARLEALLSLFNCAGSSTAAVPPPCK